MRQRGQLPPLGGPGAPDPDQHAVLQPREDRPHPLARGEVGTRAHPRRLDSSSLALIWSWATLAYAGINVAEIVLTTDAYGAGQAGFGIFVACSAGGIVLGNVLASWYIDRLTVYGGYRASFLITAAGVALCAVSPGLALGCVGAVIFGIGNGIGLVCNITLIQQTVSDDRRGQIFAVLGSLVQTFTLIGVLASA